MSPSDAREHLSRRRETMKRKAAAAPPAAMMAQQSNAGIASFKGLICPCKEELLDKIQDIPSNRLIARVVSPGMTVFLFDQGLGRLYGIYQAGASEYDDKISLQVQQRCLPLEGMELESFFLDNDIKPHVGPEVLTSSQVSRLIDMFLDKLKCAEVVYGNGGYGADHIYKDHYVHSRSNPYSHYCPYEDSIHAIENHVSDDGYLRELDEPAHVTMQYSHMPPPPSSMLQSHHPAMTSGWKCSPVDPPQYAAAAAHQMKSQRRMADPTPIDASGYPRQVHYARAAAAAPPAYSAVSQYDCGDVKVRSPLDGICGQAGCNCGQPPPSYRAQHPAEVGYHPSRIETAAAANGYEEHSAPGGGVLPQGGRNNRAYHHHVEEKPKKKAPQQQKKASQQQVSNSKPPKPVVIQNPKQQQRGTVVSTGHRVQVGQQQPKSQKQPKVKSVFNRIKPPTVFSRLGSPSAAAGIEMMHRAVVAPPRRNFCQLKSLHPPPRNTRMMKFNAKIVADHTLDEDEMDVIEDGDEATEDASFVVDFKRRVASSNTVLPQEKRRKIIRPEGLGGGLKVSETQEGVMTQS